jgi:hypothetical protein
MVLVIPFLVQLSNRRWPSIKLEETFVSSVFICSRLTKKNTQDFANEFGSTRELGAYNFGLFLMSATDFKVLKVHDVNGIFGVELVIMDEIRKLKNLEIRDVFEFPFGDAPIVFAAGRPKLLAFSLGVKQLKLEIWKPTNLGVFGVRWTDLNISELIAISSLHVNRKFRGK